VENEDWVRNPIVRFILAKLHESGLKPVGPVSKQALIRRATFDLIGFPPSPEEVDAFVHDHQPDAFAKVVDRLLSSRTTASVLALLARPGALCGWTIGREQGYTVRERRPLSRRDDPGVERRHVL
jgi:hypothetical protein